MGVKSIKTSERNGEQVGAVRVTGDDEIMLITDGGTLVRTSVADISQMSRDTQGVRLISLRNDEKLIGIERIEALEVEEGLELPEGEEASSDDAAPADEN
jgi:DNA gyrase subunit A